MGDVRRCRKRVLATIATVNLLALLAAAMLAAVAARRMLLKTVQWQRRRCRHSSSL